jgi:methylase of polypeptide subunit release factors
MLTGTPDEIAFGHLAICYDDRVLRPRAWTAGQSVWAAELARRSPPGPVLELCSGAGQIGLLAIALEPRPLVCVDVNPASAELIRDNAASAGLTHLVDVRTAPMDEALGSGERFAVVIADPPWVPRAAVDGFPEDPRLAIDGGEDGLDLARTCAEVASAHLLPGCSALVQLGTVEQAAELAAGLPDGLAAGEVRTFERGVVLRLDRASGT